VGTNAPIIGINVQSSNYNHTIRNNSIHHLNNYNSTTQNAVYGILLIALHGTNKIERNMIYALSNNTNATSSEVAGIGLYGGSVSIQNNMIAIGNEIAQATLIYGIFDSNAGNTLFHNSIYSGGSSNAGVGNSYAFYSNV
jgi:hypothetical protein